MRKFWESIYSPNYISGYNPFLLKDMNRAIERMVSAINTREKIVLYGIPNVDGLCAISSLILVLKYLNADIEYVVHDDPSGNSKINCQDIVNNVHFLGGELLINLGIDLNSKEEEELCKNLGIDIISIENKNVNTDKEYIYINPCQKGCQYRYKDLSISGLTFKLMQAIAIYYNIKSINKYLDLILIGEKWANVPLKGENGVILKEGKKFLIYSLKNVMSYMYVALFLIATMLIMQRFTMLNTEILMLNMMTLFPLGKFRHLITRSILMKTEITVRQLFV